MVMAIRVIVHGASGRAGQEIVKGLCHDSDIQIVGAVRRRAQDGFLALPDGSGNVPYGNDLAAIVDVTRPDVVVDFSTVKATMPAVRTVTSRGINMVIGTTGPGATDLDEIRQLCLIREVGVVVAPNFALGAVLMMYLAKIAARYMVKAEVTELHHHSKADAPSGTALRTSESIIGKNDDGVERVPIHSIRLPGLMAHQEVLFGTAGQTLSIRHDATSRECYVPGIIMAVKEVVKRKGLIYGLENLLNL
jgi:4-hydroxy-tetrahydrodipicolinate reductase